MHCGGSSRRCEKRRFGRARLAARDKISQKPGQQGLRHRYHGVEYAGCRQCRVMADANTLMEIGDGAGSIVVESQKDGYRLVTRTPKNELLVTNHPRLPFWSAWVDGKPARLLSVNGIQMTVGVPTGKHVALVYNLAAFRHDPKTL